MSDEQNLVADIERFMPLEEFVRINKRLTELRGEEEQKLKALAELQQYYVSSNTDAQKDKIKEAVAQIRELSRAARAEIRELNTKLGNVMPLEEARRLYALYTRET